MSDSNLQELRETLEQYFSGVGTYTAARGSESNGYEIASRWGEEAVKEGFAKVGIEARTFTLSMLRPFTDRNAFVHLLTSRMMGFMAYQHDILMGYGVKASDYLMRIIESSPNEDFKALAAYTFSADHFIRKDWSGRLEKVYSQVFGTSCKMAIALALAMCDKPKNMKSLISEGYFGSPNEFLNLVQMVKESSLGTNQSDAEKGAILAFVVPETLGVGESKLVSMLFLDIGTNGAWFEENKPSWKRKP